MNGEGMSGLVRIQNPRWAGGCRTWCLGQIALQIAILKIRGGHDTYQFDRTKLVAPHTPRPLGKPMLRVVRNESIL